MAAAPAVLRWHLNPATQLRWREWDGEWVVYDTGSGQTHQMDGLTAATLGLIEAGPIHAQTLADTLAGQLAAPDQAQLPALLAGILAQLQTLGLIDPQAAPA